MFKTRTSVLIRSLSKIVKIKGVGVLKIQDSRDQENVLVKRTQFSTGFHIHEAFQQTAVDTESFGFCSSYLEMAVFSLN